MRVAPRDRQDVLLRRPLQLLYPLEIHEAEVTEPSVEDAPASTPNVHASSQVEERDVPTPKRRPVRAAAKRAEAKRKEWIQELLD